MGTLVAGGVPSGKAGSCGEQRQGRAEGFGEPQTHFPHLTTYVEIDHLLEDGKGFANDIAVEADGLCALHHLYLC